jgi:hypothetical protein
MRAPRANRCSMPQRASPSRRLISAGRPPARVKPADPSDDADDAGRSAGRPTRRDSMRSKDDMIHHNNDRSPGDITMAGSRTERPTVPRHRLFPSRPRTSGQRSLGFRERPVCRSRQCCHGITSTGRRLHVVVRLRTLNRRA